MTRRYRSWNEALTWLFFLGNENETCDNQNIWDDGDHYSDTRRQATEFAARWNRYDRETTGY